MIIPLSEVLRRMVANLPEGEVVVKYTPPSKQKPPRRQPGIKNKSNRTDYMKNYMQDYRQEGKDYQKVPDAVKEWRREQKKKSEAEQASD